MATIDLRPRSAPPWALPHDSPVWHPFTQHGLKEPIPEIVSRARANGCIARTGYDCSMRSSSWWVITHGHCEPRISAATAAQTSKLDQLIFAGWHASAGRGAGARASSRSAPAGLGARLLLGQWLDGGRRWRSRWRSAIGTTAGEPAPPHRRDGAQLSWRHDRCDVGRRARRVQPAPMRRCCSMWRRCLFPTPGAEQGSARCVGSAVPRAGKAALPSSNRWYLGAGGILIYSARPCAEMRDARHDALFIANEAMTSWGARERCCLRAGRAFRRISCAWPKG